MKKIITLLFCSVLIFSACNKNKKFNKTLDGTWWSTVEDGQTVSSDDNTRLAFSKSGKDDGSVSITSYDSGTQQSQATGSYKITDKGETLTIDATGTTAANGNTPSSSFIYHATGKITNQNKTKFTWNVTSTITGSGAIGLTVTDNSIIEFTKQ